MIIEEYVLTRSDGVEIHRHYSDDHRYIIQQETGLAFEVAEDVTPCKYTYVEGEYFEAYIKDLLETNYPDEKIEAAISGKNYNTTTNTATTLSTDDKSLDKVDLTNTNAVYIQ